MKICVIGAGPLGLAAIKSCLEEGLDVVCFERRNTVGGLWNYIEKNPFAENSEENGQQEIGTVMRNTVANTNKETWSYSDFPVPKEFPMFLPHETAVTYFEMYAEHFKLLEHIRFGTEVIRVAKPSESLDKSSVKEGRWEVTWRELSTGKTSLELFDGVMVCNGHNSKKHMPKFKGQEEFAGKILHSQDISHNKGFEKKRVLVIGCGNSACDVAVDLSEVCSQVYQSSRRGMWMLPRLLNGGLPWDLVLNTKLGVHIRRYLPESHLTSFMNKLLNERFDHSLYRLKPTYPFLALYPVYNDFLPIRIACGAVKVKPEVRCLTSGGAEFVDGSTIDDIDVIVYATGYLLDYSFIDHPAFESKEDNDRPLYQYMFAPDIQPPTLAIIGCIDLNGSIQATGEMQTRYAVRVFKGDIKLPGAEEMRRQAEVVHGKLGSFNASNNRQNVLVSYHDYIDSLAEAIGCKPPGFFRLLFKDPKLSVAVHTGPLVSYPYRLVGPGAWPGAREAILGVKQRLVYPLGSGDTRESISDNHSSEKTTSTNNVIVVTSLLLLVTALVVAAVYC